MKSYPSYKDSGVEWIGEIPSDWVNSKLKYISNLYTGNSLNDKQKSMYESDNPNDIPYISSKDIDVDYLKLPDKRFLKIQEAFAQTDDWKLAPVRAILGNDFSYEEIRIARLFLKKS